MKSVVRLLKKISDISKDDYYIELHNDSSSTIRTIENDDYYIHNYDIKELKDNLKKLEIRLKKIYK